MNSSRAGRPSDARRKALNDELSVPSVSNFFPLDNYYQAADKVYHGFQMCMHKKALDDAYIYGKRYCKFVLEAIPEHNYYAAVRYKAHKDQHLRQVNQVVAQLEQVATDMDKDERQKQRQFDLKAQQEKQERARIELERYQELQQRAQRQMQVKKMAVAKPLYVNLEESALSKLELLRKPSTSPAAYDAGLRRDPSGEEPKGEPSTRYRLTWDDEDSSEEAQPLPPPMLPPPGDRASPTTTNGPPSYNQALHRSSRHFLGPSKVHPAPNGASAMQYTPPTAPMEPPSVPQQQKEQNKPIRKKRMPMKQLQQKYVQDYVRYQRNGRIQIMPIETYQGRTLESTNGCTVISALVAARHLNHSSSSSISDQQVVQVIDRECGPILREIRSKLGLGGSALIIPSDVHDHLVDAKILQQKHFVGAAGGDIMDPKHFGEFIKLISAGEDGKAPWSQKAAATLFFREHVISIVKSPVSPSQTFYDLVDSLPAFSQDGRGTASRTRCKDVESLQVLLRWYTSRKFSDANCSHIDRSPWDDSMADFDPRVFQGFVWAAKA
jgi:hypothetical protein